MRYAIKTFMVITAATVLVTAGSGCDNYNKKPINSQPPSENPTNDSDSATPSQANQD